MYCSHCGKKVGDTMLFCPFCGEAIVIPEQDDDRVEAATSDALPVNEPTPTVESGSTGAPVQEVPPVSAPDPAPAVGRHAATSEPEAVPEAAKIVAPSESINSDTADAAAELLDWSIRRSAQADEWARPQAPEEPFEPLKLDEDEPQEDWREQIAQKKQSATMEKKPPRMQREGDEPIRLEGSAPNLELDVKGAKSESGGRKARKHANTLVPPKTMDPEDIFMDGKAAAYDDYDDPYDDDGDDGFRESFVYEDEGESSFFMRHLRGIVGLALFAILVLMFVIYAFSKSGQITLAKVNLAWSTDAYSTLGYQSYQDKQYAQAGLYYERALQRAQDNYSYASSAAMAYLEAGETEKAAAMLKKCVDIDPTRLEPYVYLLKLYPDAVSRPWDVTQLLQQGFQRTGDERLNVTG